jgi:hypothetical protein
MREILRSNLLIKHVAKVKVSIFFLLILCIWWLLFNECLVHHIHHIGCFLFINVSIVKIKHDLWKHVFYWVTAIQKILRLLRIVRIHKVLIKNLLLVYLMSSLEILYHLSKLQKLIFEVFISSSTLKLRVGRRALKTLIFLISS